MYCTLSQIKQHRWERKALGVASDSCTPESLLFAWTPLPRSRSWLICLSSLNTAIRPVATCSALSALIQWYPPWHAVRFMAGEALILQLQELKEYLSHNLIGRMHSDYWPYFISYQLSFLKHRNIFGLERMFIAARNNLTCYSVCPHSYSF